MPNKNPEAKRATQRAWAANNRDKIETYRVAHRLRTVYGMTPEQYDALLEVQDGVCAICGKTPKENGKRLAVDHCHTQGHVRGLLCVKCNVSLAAFDHDDLILHAAAYLAVFWSGDDVPEEEV